MGDRTGLTKLDRTNGYEDGNGYMRAKKSKLAQQNDQIREALRSRNSTMRTDLFKGISINVNGRTQPTADELKRLILLNGGDYHPYYRYQTTKFMIATNLSSARMKTLRPDDRVVKPEWITESIQAKCLLPYQDYQLYADEARGKNGSVLHIDSDSSSHGQYNSSTSYRQLVSVAESYSKNYRKSRNQSSATENGKNRDIREMFSRSVRSIDHSDDRKKSESQQSTGSSNGFDVIEVNPGDSNQSDQMPQFLLDESNHSREPGNFNREQSTKSRNYSITMKDFFARSSSKAGGPSSSHEQKRYVASFRGLTRLDEITGLLNQWMSRPGGISDESLVSLTRYFQDLMSERNYHNKFYEIIDFLQQGVVQNNELSWTVLYNNLVRHLKKELEQSAEATRNLCQLLTLIDVPEEAITNDDEGPSTSGEVPAIQPVEIIDDRFNDDDVEDDID